TPAWDLEGTWDMIVSSPSGRADAVTFTLAPTRLTIQGAVEVTALIDAESLVASYEGDAANGTWLGHEPVDLGIWAIPSGGALQYSAPGSGESCEQWLSKDDCSMVCSELVRPRY